MKSSVTLLGKLKILDLDPIFSAGFSTLILILSDFSGSGKIIPFGIGKSRGFTSLRPRSW
jgi:hypothetical protein